MALKCGGIVFSSNVQFDNSIVKIPQKFLSINDIITDIFGHLNLMMKKLGKK